MVYNPLRTMNPSDEDLTIKSSIWLCSRLMPGKGNNKISFPNFMQINNTGMRTAELADLMLTGLIAMNNSEALINLLSSVSELVFNGLWAINNQPVIGHATAAKGLVAPFNTFNMGYRYKKGFRVTKDVS